MTLADFDTIGVREMGRNVRHVLVLLSGLVQHQRTSKMVGDVLRDMTYLQISAMGCAKISALNLMLAGF